MTGEVIAYEIDQSAGRIAWRPGSASRPNVRVVVGDFLASRPPSPPFQVVGNAPFSLTSPIVDWCLRASRMTTATLITQLEYARKRTGGYGRWSQLTVSTWPQVRWELRGTIARTEFRPVPRVDAGILRLERRAEPLAQPSAEGAYRRLVQAGFSGVGGSVQASLRRSYPADKVASAFALAGVDRRTVVAYVSPDQWVQIFLGLDAERPARTSSRAKTAPPGPAGRPGLKSVRCRWRRTWTRYRTSQAADICVKGEICVAAELGRLRHGAVVPDRPYLSSSLTTSSRQPGAAVEASAKIRSVMAVMRWTAPGGRWMVSPGPKC